MVRQCRALVPIWRTNLRHPWRRRRIRHLEHLAADSICRLWTNHFCTHMIESAEPHARSVHLAGIFSSCGQAWSVWGWETTGKKKETFVLFLYTYVATLMKNEFIYINRGLRIVCR